MCMSPALNRSFQIQRFERCDVIEKYVVFSILYGHINLPMAVKEMINRSSEIQHFECSFVNEIVTE